MFSSLSLSQVAKQVNAQVSASVVGVQALRVVTDSRLVQTGDLFVALTGERFDAHDYLAEVAAKGAVAAIVEREVEAALPQLLVDSSVQALGKIALLNRDQFTGKTVAVTGSSGKTTVKEMLASIFRTALGEEQVLATKGNLNNELGVPFTLLELSAQHQAAVIELGASHIGEIAYTVALAQPEVAIITNAGNAHVGEFGGVENIIKAKGEILQGLDETGVAVLNLDDQAFTQWQAGAGQRKILSYSLKNERADYFAKNITVSPTGELTFVVQATAETATASEYSIRLQLLGVHNVANALAAIAAARATGISWSAVIQGLANLTPVVGRMQMHRLAGSYLIDDSYNANPISVCAAIDVLTQMPGYRVLVLGDMGELGEWVQEGHAQVGRYANDKVDALYAVGEQSQYAVNAFTGEKQLFSTQPQLIEHLQGLAGQVNSILIKGSRSAAMDQVVHALLAGHEEKR